MAILKETTDLAFRKRADQYIHVANQQVDEEEFEKVSASFIYASSRFASFVVAANSENADDMQNDRQQAIDYFTQQFRGMLVDNIDDHIHNFDIYVTQPPSDN